MKITEKKLRKIIRNMIKESIDSNDNLINPNNANQNENAKEDPVNYLETKLGRKREYLDSVSSRKDKKHGLIHVVSYGRDEDDYEDADVYHVYPDGTIKVEMKLAMKSRYSKFYKYRPKNYNLKTIYDPKNPRIYKNYRKEDAKYIGDLYKGGHF